ncbi:MAG TPA: PASTA domain-containing protein [bacterium]|nr:PASTA domain-containing protein [bacterium]
MRAAPPPNVVGYLLDEARAVLAEAGWDDVETAETRPPRRGLLPPYRVLRQRVAGGRIALVIAGERSATAGRAAADHGADGVPDEDART